jgi:hypothetical protein
MDKQQIEQKIKETLLQYLNEGKKITLTWDCGGDEAFVQTAIDGKELSVFENGQYQEHEFPALLEHFIITELNLPDAGEFSLKGKGEILLEDNKITIIYETVELSYEDWTYAEEEENGDKDNKITEEKHEQDEDDEEESEYSSTYVNASPEEYAGIFGQKSIVSTIKQHEVFRRKEKLF